MERVLNVGLDYHKNSVQVCALDGDGRVIVRRRAKNDWIDIKRSLKDHDGPVFAAIEVGNGAADLADELVNWASWSVDLAHPGYVKRMRQNRDKTDVADAQLLADLVRVGYLPKVWLPPQPIRELRRLVNHRRQLVNRRRSLKLSIGSMLNEQRVTDLPGGRWSRQWMAAARNCDQLTPVSRWLMEERFEMLEGTVASIARAEKMMVRLTANDPVVQRLVQFPGVGLVTACILRAAVGRFDRFRSGKQLARFCGLSPRNVSSGDRKADAGLMDACDRHLRATLMQLGHRLRRMPGRWREMSQRLIERGKPGSVANAAVVNRWMRWLYYRMAPLGAGY